MQPKMNNDPNQSNSGAVSSSRQMSSTIAMCCAAAMFSETVTYPLDMVKTRLQVFSELSRHSNPRVLRLFMTIIKTEGALKLWQGLSPALVRHLIYTGSRVPIYETVRRDVFNLPPATKFTVTTSTGNPNLDELPKQNIGFIAKAASAGMFAGGVAQFLASPADLIKVRLQTEHRRISESHLTSSSSFRNISSGRYGASRSLGFMGALRQTVAQGGLLSLWRGGLPNIQRAALVNMGELTTYDSAKRWFAVQFRLKDGPLLHVCASTVSGFVAAVLGTPADLIKTRIMNQRVSDGNPPTYNGMLDCFRKIVSAEGVQALYKGFFLIWARMAPWSLTFWLTYEKIRVFVGIGGF